VLWYPIRSAKNPEWMGRGAFVFKIVCGSHFSLRFTLSGYP